MKKIGLIGGLGPEATVDYYKEIIKTFNEKDNNLIYPEIIIYSVNMSEFLNMMKNKEYEKAILYLLYKIDALAGAGADFAAITANTPHQLFDRLNKESPIPLISIVEATSKAAEERGLKKCGLFGTSFTMNAGFYQEVFSKNNMEIIVPDPKDREVINEKLFSEIELGIFKDATRDMLIEIIDKMKNEKNIDSIILGCTEFPLILKEQSYVGIPVLDTTRIHVREIINYCL